MLAKSTLILFAALAALGPVAMPQVNALSNQGPPPARRAEHVNMSGRMIRKRGVAPRINVAPVKRQVPPILGGGGGGGDDPADDPPADPAEPSPNTSTGTTSTQTTPTTTTTTTGRGPSIVIDPVTTTSTQPTTSSVPTTSSTTSTSSRTSATSTASETVETEAPESETVSSVTRTSGRATSIVFETAKSTAQVEDKSKDTTSSFIPKPVLIGLIVAAASCVAAAALWTIIRKWKFGASRKFEDRLEPVNWEPSTTGGAAVHDPTTLAVHRANSVNSHARSSEEHGNAYGGYNNNMTSVNNQGVSLAPELPPHDFTAAPGAGGYGGYGGYADMQRGPSPAPPALQRGPSSNGHGDYGMPNPYDAYDYNSGYNNNNGPGRHQF